MFVVSVAVLAGAVVAPAPAPADDDDDDETSKNKNNFRPISVFRFGCSMNSLRWWLSLVVSVVVVVICRRRNCDDLLQTFAYVVRTVRWTEFMRWGT